MTATAARGHMPFKGHRTQQEVREEEERLNLIRLLERELREGQREVEAERAWRRA